MDCVKYWVVTLSASVAWAGAVLGLMYLHTHAQNDALDEKYGQVAGCGFVLVWAFALLYRWKKKTAANK